MRNRKSYSKMWQSMSISSIPNGFIKSWAIKLQIKLIEMYRDGELELLSSETED